MLERLLKSSIEHRWLVVVLTLGVGAFGVVALRDLPIDAVPDITNVQVQINTVAAELSPVEIEKQVTLSVETALSGIPGLESTRSLSRNGFSQVTAIFADDVDIWFARQQVGERLAQAREALPAGIEPSMGPISTGLGEVYMYAVEFEHPRGEGAVRRAGDPGWQPDGTYLTPESRRLANDVEFAAYLREVQDWIIRPQLMKVRDVAGVDSIGGYVKQYHVQPDPLRLVAHDLTFHDLIEALEANNVATGAGYIEHRGESYSVRAAGRIGSPDEIGRIAIATRDGRPIAVADVADVIVGKELRTGSASENGNEVVIGTALMLIGANSRTVAASVGEKVSEIGRSLPADVRVRAVLDRTTLVDATIATVKRNLGEGAILVIVILFLLLGNVRAALIVATAIPLSMLMTSTVMVREKISGNLMSLGAIDFGLVVDGAVIIVENCLRCLAEKQRELGRRLDLRERLDVVFDAARQVRGATAFGEAIIITVYLPILALTGVEGKMFHPMALTVIIALASAFILSLTFIPAMTAIFVSGPVREKENVFVSLSKRLYRPVLERSLHARYFVLAGAALVFAGSMFLFNRLGQEFVPTLDEGNIAMHALRLPSTGIDQSTSMQRRLERSITEVPEVQLVFSKTGTAEMASDPMPPHVSDTFVMLRPREEWPDPEAPKSDVIARVEAAAERVPGHAFEFTQPIQMRFNELISGVRSDLAVKVYGDEFEAMMPVASAIAKALEGLPGAADVKVEQTQGLPTMDIDIDREALARYGLSMADVQEVIAAAIGGRGAGDVFEGDRRFELVVRLPESIRADLDRIRSLPIPLPKIDDSAHDPDDARLAAKMRSTAAPRYVPLSVLATVRIEEGLNQVSRENGKRRIVVQANVRGRDLGSFVDEARRTVDAEVKLAPGQWLEWGGQFENLVAAKQRLEIVIPICFVVIALLLYATFKSARDAAMVFICVPLALTGGVLALFLRDMPFSISAAVGFIALSGVAVLNGLVMVTFINQLVREGRPVDDAIVEGSLTRLRPVLTTALVASLGFIPMAIAQGTGAEVQRPLATVVIGGIVSSTLLTLIVMPSLYRLVHGVGLRRDTGSN